MKRFIKTTLLPAFLLGGLLLADAPNADADRPFGLRVGRVGVNVGSHGGVGVRVSGAPVYHGGFYGPVYRAPHYGHGFYGGPGHYGGGGLSFWIGDRDRPSTSTPPAIRPLGTAPVPGGIARPVPGLRPELRPGVVVPRPDLGRGVFVN